MSPDRKSPFRLIHQILREGIIWKKKRAENSPVLQSGHSKTNSQVTATGRNVNQTDAMVDGVEEAATKAGFEPDHIEGHHNANWTLLDYKGVIVHIFDEESRGFYDLDRLWKDGTEIDPNTL